MRTRKTSPIERIAIARPPEHWFHGIDLAIFRLYRDELVDLGVEVFEVPVDAFQPPDPVRIAELRAAARAFRPQLAIGFPHGTYALICRDKPGADGFGPNFFTDILEIPTLCRWDHAPFDFADQLLQPAPRSAGESRGDALETLRRVLRHPRLIHWSRDTGQTQLMSRLGLLSEGEVIHEPSPALRGFDPGLRPPPPADSAPVAFVGHLYQEPPVYPEPELAELAERSVKEWLEAPGKPLWDCLLAHIDAMDGERRARLALDPSQTCFWHFSNRVTRYHAQTPLRLRMLGAVRPPVVCYGNLREGLPGVSPKLRAAPGHIPFGPDLAAALSRHSITIDVCNPAMRNGYGHKPVLGFASGGFLLYTRKQDFVDAFGEAGELVTYNSAEELACKTDRYLAAPKLRREIGDEIRSQIAARFRARDVLRRVLEQVSERIGAMPLAFLWKQG